MQEIDVMGVSVNNFMSPYEMTGHKQCKQGEVMLLRLFSKLKLLTKLKRMLSKIVKRKTTNAREDAGLLLKKDSGESYLRPSRILYIFF